MKWLLLFLFAIILTGELQAQTVVGRVYDASNFTPLPGTTVLNLQDSTGTVADHEGEFQIDPSEKIQYFIISHLGYHPVHVEIHPGQTELIIGLQAAETNLSEVIVNASQINMKLQEVPAPVHLLTQHQLQRNNSLSLAPALNLVPGVYMQSGGLNTNRITIRGAGARTPYGTNKIRAYFNDIPLSTGEGETMLEDIDLNTMQRVEILKGPTSSIFGAGLGGTINISALTGRPASTGATMKSTIGSFGLIQNHVRFTHGNSGAQINFSYSDTQREGFRENSSYDRKSALFNGVLHSGDKGMLTMLAQYTFLKAYIPSSLDEFTFITTPKAAATSWKQAKGFEAYHKTSLGLSHQYEFNEKLKNITSVFIHWRDADEPRPFDILRENSIATGIRSRVITETSLFNRKASFSGGFEYFSDWYGWSTYENLYQQHTASVAGEMLSDNKERRNYYNIFAQAGLELSQKLTFQGGLNFNGTSYRLQDLYSNDSIDQSGKYTFTTILSPRAAFNYQVDDSRTLYASISHGFSPPSLEETLTPEGSINTDIQPETGWNYEIGSRSYWLEDRLYTSISLYHMDIKNLLVAQRTGPDRYVGVNAGRTKHSGLEAFVSFEAADGQEWSVKPFFSGTLMRYRFDKFIDQENDYSGNALTGVPSNIFNAGIDLRTDLGFYFYSDYRYVGAIPLNDSNSKYTDSYQLINLKAGYNFEVWRDFSVDVAGGINNLTNETYASMVLVNAVGFGGSLPRYYYPGLPRNYFASLRVRYIFK